MRLIPDRNNDHDHKICRRCCAGKLRFGRYNIPIRRDFEVHWLVARGQRKLDTTAADIRSVAVGAMVCPLDPRGHGRGRDQGCLEPWTESRQWSVVHFWGA